MTLKNLAGYYWLIPVYILLQSCQQIAARTHSQPVSGPVTASSVSATPLPNAYAHNDYWQKRPLFDALDNGYTYIEVDIFKVGDEFIVAHLIPFFRQRKTLENMYLRPLYERISRNNGYVYPGYKRPITLMIDIKMNGESTYRSLKPLFKRYQRILTSYTNGVLEERQVTIVLSGSKPFHQLQKENIRYAFIDEDLRKIKTSVYGKELCPISSCKYTSLINWDGENEIPEPEKQKLVSYVLTAHAQGKKVRLWATPEKENLWNTLLEYGVDMINTDRLTSLKTFLVNRSQAEKMSIVSINHSSPTVLTDRK